MTKSDNIKKKAIIEALHKTLGVVTSACKIAKISRQTFYRWLTEDEEFKKEVADIENVALDFVESKHYQLINEGNPANIIFHLKTKGKDRGYQEITKAEISGGIKVADPFAQIRKNHGIDSQTNESD